MAPNVLGNMSRADYDAVIERRRKQFDSYCRLYAEMYPPTPVVDLGVIYPRAEDDIADLELLDWFALNRDFSA